MFKVLQERKKANELAIEKTKEKAEAEQKLLVAHTMAINEKVREDLDEITNSSKQQDEVI